jgi:aryl-alcohol dehydrogenase-like predicted oxidoreductase
MSRALDLGIDMIDASDMYTGGESEKLIGNFVKGRREDVILTTKAGREAETHPDTPPNRAGASRKNIMYRLQQSLERLQTDYIDLYYVHKYDIAVPLEETMRTLDYLVRLGKIRYIACSNFDAEQIDESRAIADKLGLENFIAVQNSYSLFDQEMEEKVIPYCRNNGLGTLAYSPLSGGFLAGRYERNSPPPPGSRATYRPPSWMKSKITEENFRKLDKIKKVAKIAGVSLPILAISWILREGKANCAVVGASDPSQLDDPVKAVEAKLPTEITSELKDL